jgi:hypothetical protein
MAPELGQHPRHQRPAIRISGRDTSEISGIAHLVMASSSTTSTFNSHWGSPACCTAIGGGGRLGDEMLGGGVPG